MGSFDLWHFFLFSNLRAYWWMSKNQATSSFLSHFFLSQRFGCQFSKATYACHWENFFRLNLNNVWFRLATYTGLSTSLLCTTTKLGLFPIIKFWSLKRKGQRRKESYSIIKHMFHVHPFFPAKAFQINSWYVCSIMSSWWCITAYRQQRLLMPTCFFWYDQFGVSRYYRWRTKLP